MDALLLDVKTKLDEIDTILPILSALRTKLTKKKTISGEVIERKMKVLHELIACWQQRFLDTTNETLDEKIATLTNQEKQLRELKKQITSFQSEFGSRKITSKESKALGITPERENDDDDESSLTIEDTEDDEMVEIRSMLVALSKLQFPLKPNGVKPEEVDSDVATELDLLLDEACKSLKRSLTNIGGIVRGYHRRGQNNKNWVQELRRMESRFEKDVASPDMAMSSSLSFYQTSEYDTRAARNARQVWKVLSDMFYSIDSQMRDGLCKQLRTLDVQYPGEIEFYLCQLINILLHNKNFTILEEFLFAKCRESQHFAVQTYFMILSMGDHGSPRWTNKCKKLLVKLEAAIPADPKASKAEPAQEDPNNSPLPPLSPEREDRKSEDKKTEERKTEDKKTEDRKSEDKKPESRKQTEELSPALDESNGVHKQRKKPLSRAIRRAGKDYFFSSVSFLKELVTISQKISQKLNQPELYEPELRKQLEGLSKFIQEGSAFLPHNSQSRHLILKVLPEFSYPIPTFSRVLYHCLLEAIAIPNTIISPQEVKDYLQLVEKNEIVVNMEPPSSDPKPATPFGEGWIQKCKRIRSTSEYGKLPGWDVPSFIIKQGDFVLQEQFVIQMLAQFQRIFDKERVPIRLKLYKIMALSSDSGIIEFVPNTLSIDKLKQKLEEGTSLRKFFKQQWPDKADFNRAMTNFVQSLAAYSIVCYFLQIKDRHNANIMIDSYGNLLHIDFGYLLARTVEFEKAPFKLTEEIIDVLGGEKSKLFAKYEELCIQGFFAIRKHYRKILTLVQMTLTAPIMGGQFLPCLSGDSLLKNLRKRFHLEDNKSKIETLVKSLIAESSDNWRTNIYDAYQKILQGIH